MMQITSRFNYQLCRSVLRTSINNAQLANGENFISFFSGEKFNKIHEI